MTKESAEQALRRAIRDSFENRHDREKWGPGIDRIRAMRRNAAIAGFTSDEIQKIVDEEVDRHDSGHKERA